MTVRSALDRGPWTVDRGPWTWTVDRGPWTDVLVPTLPRGNAVFDALRRLRHPDQPSQRIVERSWVRSAEKAPLGSFGRDAPLGSFGRIGFVRQKRGFGRQKKPLWVRSAERDWVRSAEEATLGSFGRTRLGCRQVGSFGRGSHFGFVRRSDFVGRGSHFGFVRQKKPLWVRSAERDWVRSAEEATLGSVGRIGFVRQKKPLWVRSAELGSFGRRSHFGFVRQNWVRSAEEATLGSFGSSASPSLGAAESFQLVKEPGRTGPYPWYRQRSAGTLRGFRESHRNSPPRSLCGAFLGFAGWASLRRRWAWEGDAGIAHKTTAGVANLSGTALALAEPPTPTLPHKGGGSQKSPPPLWGRVGVGGLGIART